MKLAKYMVGASALVFAVAAQSTPFTEGFDDISLLAGNGWVQTNNSTPATGPWFQGNSGVFGSQAGAPNSYVANNFNAGGTAIDTWLISPEITLASGSVLSFWTRTEIPDFADQVEVYFNAGSSSSVGDFSNLLMTIGGGPYPVDWTAFSAALPNAASGRFAFRYNVSNANFANYIGIDTVSVDAAPVPEPSTYALLGLGLIGLSLVRRKQRASQSA